MSKRQPIPNHAKHALEDAYKYAIYIQRQLKPLAVDERQALPSRITIVVRAARAIAAAAKMAQVIVEAHPTAPRSKRDVEVL